jgi:hypothetical protein
MEEQKNNIYRKLVHQSTTEEWRLLFISIYISNFERDIVNRVCHVSHSLDTVGRHVLERTGGYWSCGGPEWSAAHVGNKGADKSGREAEGQEVRRGFSLCAAPS